MRFGVLGGTEVHRADGSRVTVGGARLRALLVLLLLDADRVVAVDRLIDGLYGARPPARAGNALQSQVSRLRQVLSGPNGQVAPLEFHPAGYRLAVDPDTVDVHRFVRLATAGRAALAAGDARRATDLLRSGLELWRGEPLADVTEAPFAPVEADRLRQRRLAAIEDRVEADLSLLAAAPGTTDAESLVTELRELVAAHPLRERLRGQLMRALYATGRRAEALATFAELRRLLADELGVDPSAELTALHVALLRGADLPGTEPAAAPAPTSPTSVVPSASVAPPTSTPPAPNAVPAGAVAPSGAAPSTTLPSQLTTFVGRAEELRLVGKLLGEARLVTLHGPGGAGKTRLAIEAAARHGGEVCLVELATVAPGGDVAQAVLAALNLRDTALRVPGGPRDVTDRMIAALAGRRMLLVLDNCEHVVADAARLAARLLAAAPMLRVLATSREPLGVTGEALCPVLGLPVPPLDTPAELAREYAAVRLFADRAADVAPGFTIDAGTVAAVLRICRTLDGLPLAIELAAARLRALPVAEVAARLDDRFRLLSRGSRVAQPRHQTLRAVVRWSWDLLNEAEQRLARRLSVFAGSATLEAVERVCAPGGADVLDTLTSLVEKSLVEATGGRFRMLETVRAFAAERLTEAGETDRFRRAHAAYFLELAQTGDAGLRGAGQLEWLRRLDADRDDLHAALRRSVHGGDLDTALPMVAALAFYWWLRGLRGEGAALAGQLVDRLGGPPPGLVEEYGLCLLVASLGGTTPRDLEPVRTIMWSLGRPPRYPFLLYLSGTASGPPPTERWAALHAPGGRDEVLGTDPWSRALGSLGVGMTWLLDGRYDLARTELTSALAQFRAIGERWGMIMVLTTLIELAYRHRDPAAATEPMDEALRLADELGSALDKAELLRTRADGRLSMGDLDGAQSDYRRVLELAQPAGAPELIAAARHGLAEIARQRGDLDRARQLVARVFAEGPTGWFGADMVRLAAQVTLARIEETTGDVAAARARYNQVIRATDGVWDVPTLVAAIEGLVGPVLHGGDAERAARQLGAVSVLLAGTAAAAAVHTAPVANRTRDRIGDPAYARAFARGATLSREEAAALLDAG